LSNEFINEVKKDVKAQGNYIGQDWTDEAKAVQELESYFSNAGEQDLLGWIRDQRGAVGRLQAKILNVH
jgi:hypothetical protein